jgi:hypothetical protein
VRLPPLFSIFFINFLLLHANGVVVSHLFPAADIAVTASSVATAAILGVIILQVTTRLAQTMMTMVMLNEMRQGVPSTQPFNPRPREGKGKGNEGEGGGHCCGRRW